MNFFENQDQARKRTTLLVLLFSLAVIVIGGVVGAGVHFLLIADLDPDELPSPHHWNFVATAHIIVYGIILLGSAHRLSQLSKGGRVVAESLGGELISGSTSDPLERRCLNIVEEMAIASGLPVPPVYVMKTELGLNAFAAGWSPDDAVVGVTRGILEALDREQLQGVIAHEFSHILNRDSALNLRLMGILHGLVILAFIGGMLMRFGAGSGRHSSSRNNSAWPLLLAGLAIWVLGSLGSLAARFIQAAVSRQREYLADASAVQFTRNPTGLAGALATIGMRSSALNSSQASEASHMLFGEPAATSLFDFGGSHPPLEKRIAQVMPSWDGDFGSLASSRRDTSGSRIPTPAERGSALGSAGPLRAANPLGGDNPVGGVAGAILETAVIAGALENPAEAGTQPAPQASTKPATADAPLANARQLLDSVPMPLRLAAEEPFSARALILAWLFSSDPQRSGTQVALLSADPPLLAEVEGLTGPLVSLPESSRLPLFDIALGTLASLSKPQAEAFVETLDLIAAQISPQGFQSYCLAKLTRRRLQAKRKRSNDKLLIKTAIEMVLGVLAYEGHDRADEVEAAFRSGSRQLGPRGTSLELLKLADLDIIRFDSALSTILALPLKTRADILAAAEVVAAHDGVLRASEETLLRTMATYLGVGHTLG